MSSNLTPGTLIRTARRSCRRHPKKSQTQPSTVRTLTGLTSSGPGPSALPACHGRDRPLRRSRRREAGRLSDARGVPFARWGLTGSIVATRCVGLERARVQPSRSRVAATTAKPDHHPPRSRRTLPAARRCELRRPRRVRPRLANPPSLKTRPRFCRDSKVRCRHNGGPT